jgi:hypothetical protein
MSFFPSFKKYKYDYVRTFTVVSLGIVAVMGWHWTDVAKTSFWWNFWMVAAIASSLVLGGAWLYMWNKQKQDKL